MPSFDYSWWDDDGELSCESETSSEDEDPEPEPEPPAPSVVASTPKVVRPTKATRPSTQQATKQSKDRVAAKSSPYLKSPRTTTYSLSSLHEMMTSGTINLDPEYQRAFVWSTQKQENLIDSLYHNFYVPPIIFATTIREEDGAEMRTCIDGKQRLTSMRLFMDGELSHKDSVKGSRSWFSNPKGSKRKLISTQWQIKFKNTQIACVEYEGITDEQQREIFQRVQMGVTLTPAERLQSANGPIADLIREVRTKIGSTEGFEAYLDWGKAKDFKALAEIAYLITHARTNKFEPTVPRLETFLDNKPHPLSAAKSRQQFLAILQPTMPNVMDTFCRIVKHPELGESLRNNVSPLEFVMSAYLVFCYGKKLSDTQLSHAVAQMRRNAQRSFKDLKFDNAKCKHVLNFIHKTMVELIPTLNTDGRGDIEGTCTKPATKRKRSESDEPLQTKKHKPKRKQSSPVSNFEDKMIDIGPPPKPRAPKSRPSINTSRSSAPVSKAQTTIKRTPAKQQSTSSQMNDLGKSAQLGRSMPANKNEGLQVATSSVKPPPSTRIVSASQQVISKLGSHLLEPVALGRRAEAARTAALNQSCTTRPAIPPIQTQAAPPLPNSQRGPSLHGRQRSLNVSGHSPVHQQSTVPCIVPSISSGSATLPSDARSTSNNSARIRAGASRDRLAPLHSAKLATSNRSASIMGSNSGFSRAPRPGSVGPADTYPSPTIPTSLKARTTDSTHVDDADKRWQTAFSDLLPLHSGNVMVSSRVIAPVEHSGSTTVRMEDDVQARSRSIEGSNLHPDGQFGTLPTPTSSPIAPTIQPSGWSQNQILVPEQR